MDDDTKRFVLEHMRGALETRLGPERPVRWAVPAHIMVHALSPDEENLGNAVLAATDDALFAVLAGSKRGMVIEVPLAAAQAFGEVTVDFTEGPAQEGESIVFTIDGQRSWLVLGDESLRQEVRAQVRERAAVARERHGADDLGAPRDLESFDVKKRRRWF